MDIIKKILNKYIEDNNLICAYFDNYLNEKEITDTNLYLIFKDEKTDFKEIYDLFDESCFIVFKEEYRAIQTIHFVLDGGDSLYIHKTKYIYNYDNLEIIYNCQGLKIEEEDLSEVNNNLVEAVVGFTNQLNKIYKFLIVDNNILSFTSLVKANEYVMLFLANYLLNVPYYKEWFYPNMDMVINKMDNQSIEKYHEIIELMNVKNVKECVKLLIWFMDNYIGNIPISIAKRIDIDYYLCIKNLFMKL